MGHSGTKSGRAEKGSIMKRVLFVRHFTRLFGGHIRHWHYWQHVKKAPGLEPLLLFKGKWDRSDNPWRNEGRHRIERLDWSKVDILLIGGMSWQQVGAIPPRIPIINTIQGTQHSDPPRSAYLGRKAIRICMSTQIMQIIRSRAKGPIFVNNPALDVPIKRGGKRDIPLLIVGHKRKPLARKIKAAFPRATNVTAFIPREKLLGLMYRSRIIVGLPKSREGFYLPALEAMCAGALVICPDCVGNRELVTHDYNCLQPIYTSGHIVDAVRQALKLTPKQRQRLINGGYETAKRNRTNREYRKLLSILKRANHLWTK
jgi:glycosyltransferase involved in cell wall biosynthesis